jgi:cysteine synthase
MIEDAEEKGLISPGCTTLVELTSGNMGIGLAYISLLRGYRFVAVMPAGDSLDKHILLRYLGADVALTGKDCSCSHGADCYFSHLQDWHFMLKSSVKCCAVFRSYAWLSGTT